MFKHSRLLPLLLTSSLMCAASMASAGTLKQSIKHAFKTNPDIQFQVAERFVAGEQVKQMKSRFLPTVELAAGYGRERTDNPTAVTVQGSTDTKLTRREASATLTQNLFAGGGNISEVKRTRSHLHAETHHIVRTAADVAIDVTEKYLDVLRYQQLVNLAKINLREHKRVYEIINERSESGLGKRADVSQAKSRLDLAHSNLVAERMHLTNANVAYWRVVGKHPKKLRWPRSPSSKVLPHSLKKALKKAYRHSPALKAITADVFAHEEAVRTAKSFMLPRVDLVLSASRNKNLDGIRGLNNDDLAMVRATYTVFRGGENAARVREASYEMQKALEERNITLRDMDEDVRVPWYQIRSINNRIVYLRGHKHSAYSSLKAYREQFKIGKRTLLDLLDAENEYYESRVELINALHDEILERYRLLEAMGTLLTFLKVNPPVEATVPEAKKGHLI